MKPPEKFWIILSIQNYVYHSLLPYKSYLLFKYNLNSNQIILTINKILNKKLIIIIVTGYGNSNFIFMNNICTVSHKLFPPVFTGEQRQGTNEQQYKNT